MKQHNGFANTLGPIPKARTFFQSRRDKKFKVQAFDIEL